MFDGEYEKIKHLSRQVQIRKMKNMLWQWDPYKKMTARTFKPRSNRSLLSVFNNQELYELMVEVYNSKKKIKYFLISFVDLFGVLRSKLVPAQAINDMQKNGAGFAGFATWLDMTPADADMFAIPDPDSLIQLPWKKEVGWLASDLWMNGKPVEASPRVMLKNQIKELSKKKFTMKSGVECEYFLISQDGKSIADLRDTHTKTCYD